MRKITVLIALALVAILAGALRMFGQQWAPRITYMTIAVTENVYTNAGFSNKAETAWTWLTGSDNYTKLWGPSGWDDDYRAIAATGVTVRVYHNSLRNIKGNLYRTVSPSIRTNWIARIKEHPQVEAAINDDDITTLLASWGVESKPEPPMEP